jgi:hypothetical protein
MTAALGISLTHNPIGYLEKYKKFPFYILGYMASELMNNAEFNSERYFQSFIALWRTCSELALEYGYHKGLPKYINVFNNNFDIFNKSNIFELVTTFGELLACNTPLSTELFNEFIIKALFKIIYDYKKINNFKLSSKLIDVENLYETGEVIKNLETEILKNIYNKNEEIMYLIGFYRFAVFMKKWIKSYGGYKEFIINIDKRYSITTSEEFNNFRKYKEELIIDLEYYSETVIKVSPIILLNKNYLLDFIKSIDKKLVINYYAINLITILFNKKDAIEKIHLEDKYYGLIPRDYKIDNYVDLIKYVQILYAK